MPRERAVARAEAVEHLDHAVEVAQAEELALVLFGTLAHAQVGARDRVHVGLEAAEYVVVVAADALGALHQLVDVGLATRHEYAAVHFGRIWKQDNKRDKKSALCILKC